MHKEKQVGSGKPNLSISRFEQQMDVWFCRAPEPMPRGALLRVKIPETVDLHALPSVLGTPVP